MVSVLNSVLLPCVKQRRCSYADSDISPGSVWIGEEGRR